MESAVPSSTLASDPARKLTFDDSEPSRAVRDEVAALTAAGEGGARLEVRVYDALLGSPVSGARVTLHDLAEPIPRLTDAEGRCTLPQLDLEREALLTVEHAGYAPHRWTMEWRASATIRLHPVFRLEARVVAADSGAPVSGARVEFTRPFCSKCEPESVTTDADGRFSIDALGRERQLTLTLSAAGFAPVECPVFVRLGSPDCVYEIRLPRGVHIHGLVVDMTTGSGISGARVGPIHSDDSGRFDGFVLPVSETQPVRIDVTAPGHVQLEVSLRAEELAGEQRFALPAPAWLEGEVRERTGDPVPYSTLQHFPGSPATDEEGERIESSPLYELPEGWSYELDPDHVEADASGHFRLAVMPWALNGEVWVYSDEHDTAVLPWRTTAPPGESQRLDPVLTPGAVGATLDGGVLLNGEDWPLDGAVSWRGPVTGSMRLDERAKFSCEVAPGDYEIIAELDLLPGVPSEPLKVRVHPYSRCLVHPEVRVPELTISGRVSYPDGTPAAGIEIEARAYAPRRLGRPFALRKGTRTDARGNHAVRVIDFGQPYEITCRVPGGDDQVLTASPGAQGIDFIVPRAAVLRVRVRDGRSGEVLSGGYQLLVGWERRSFERVVPLSDQPDPGGYTAIPLLEERVNLLALPLPEVFPTLAPVLALSVAPFASAEPIELVLVPGVTLELELAPDALRPDARHELYLVEESLWSSIWRSDWDDSPMAEFAQRRRVNFDERGHARIEALAPGPVRFRLFPDVLFVTPASFRLDPGQPPVEVHCSPR
jgi:protocatechuate 3,4-dioxygenase beta subunit